MERGPSVRLICRLSPPLAGNLNLDTFYIYLFSAVRTRGTICYRAGGS